MKKHRFLLFFGLLLAGTAAQAQEYRTKLSGSDRKVVIEMQYGSEVTVEGYEGDELIIKGDKAEEPPKRAEGLRAVYNSAVDNTRMGLAVTKEANTVRIVKASRQDGHYTIRVPRNADVVYREVQWGGGAVLLQNLQGKLEVAMKSADAKLLNVAGPVVANSTSGDITVRYNSLGNGPSSISNISGAIDVALPTATKATLTMRTISGEVYTDFDIALPKPANSNGLTQIGGQTLNGAINGGGTSISLKNVSGDVYVRKAK
ncbi:DUF4097 family beta strand repeat-containing protein [Hymenobacter fodinae]|uniref:DUF4097 domain-containing protein n=1 Tax=Hymenobacter fodinae TaxID=2510796 RepID=A0A4Z0PCW0_9BACT|nr:DUF4097 family beta strand repeat-containing protein [Hymenobacter fodinae]TGE10312.1 hypothetical protein EU556_05710 [Hymenobacter fodinae]